MLPTGSVFSLARTAPEARADRSATQPPAPRRVARFHRRRRHRHVSKGVVHRTPPAMSEASAWAVAFPWQTGARGPTSATVANCLNKITVVIICRVSGITNGGFQMNAFRAFSIAIGVVLVAGHAGPIQAEEAEGARSGAIEEVLVTARKREESLQEVPVAVSAFTGEQMIDSGIDQFSDHRPVHARPGRQSAEHLRQTPRPTAWCCAANPAAARRSATIRPWVSTSTAWSTRTSPACRHRSSISSGWK